MNLPSSGPTQPSSSCAYRTYLPPKSPLKSSSPLLMTPISQTPLIQIQMMLLSSSSFYSTSLSLFLFPWSFSPSPFWTSSPFLSSSFSSSFCCLQRIMTLILTQNRPLLTRILTGFLLFQDRLLGHRIFCMQFGFEQLRLFTLRRVRDGF